MGFILSIFLGMVLVWFVLHLILQYGEAEEEKRREEEKIAAAEQKKIENRLMDLRNTASSFDFYLKKIENLDYDYDETDMFAVYNGLGYFDIESKVQDNEEFLKYITDRKRQHVNELREGIARCFEIEADRPSQSIIYVPFYINCLKIIGEEEAAVADKAIDLVEGIMNDGWGYKFFADFLSSYGEWPDFDQMMDRFRTSGDHYEEGLLIIEQNFRCLQDGTCEAINNHLNKDIIHSLALLLWYFATRSPFDINKFERVCSIFEKFTHHVVAVENNDYEDMVCLEELIAKLYVIINVGGNNEIKEAEETVLKWVNLYCIDNEEYRTEADLTVELEILPSSLAWMELYDLERRVLSAIFTNRFQMSDNLQDRIKFLDKTKNVNVQMFENQESDYFCYDSASLDWNNEQFSVLFKKMRMKNKIINYSLVLDLWKKTIPLMKGQKVDDTLLYQRFSEMIEDYDGEVTCKTMETKNISARSIVSQAIIFEFNSERNRCLSMMFSGEKYGKNYNITILTLFTPNDNYDAETLLEYCLALKNSVYVDGFKESILQTVDEMLVPRQTIYNSEEQRTDDIYE